MVKINVTPIIDVALVLVIILLVTAPMMSMSDLPVDLPAAHARDTERPDFISLTLAKDGRLAIDEAELGGLDEVAPRLRERLAARRDKDRLVVVRADASLPHVAVRRLLEAAREGGARNLGIATSQITDGRP
ncbi:MAG: biopolymer transporter ExbD [bacterium]|jgi:biopolymer transport protein TolR|nr:biopolymer transporter ExbD [bacterium]